MTQFFKKKIAAELFFILVLPLLLAFNLDLQTSNVVIFPFAALLISRIVHLFIKGEITIKKDFADWNRLGLSTLYYALFTVLAVTIIFLLRPYVDFPEWLKNGEPWWFLALHALLQELIFRVYTLNRLQVLLASKILVIFVGALIFALSHSILPDSFSVVVLTFVSGLFLSGLHLKYPNFLFLVLSHFVVNLIINHF